MAKRLVAKVGEYQKDGQTKGEYQKIGVLMQSNDGGEYILLDPSINLAGVLLKQNALAATKGGQARDSVMISVFDDSAQQQSQGYQQQQSQGYQQQGGYNQPQQQGGFAPQQGGYNQPQQQQGDNIPF